MESRKGKEVMTASIHNFSEKFCCADEQRNEALAGVDVESREGFYQTGDARACVGADGNVPAGEESAVGESG